jgi:ABC-type phosphate transport system permease subunit
MTSQDAVPKEVRDASLSLGKTIKRTLGKTRKGGSAG